MLMMQRPSVRLPAHHRGLHHVAPHEVCNKRKPVTKVDDCKTTIPEAALACLNGMIEMLTG